MKSLGGQKYKNLNIVKNTDSSQIILTVGGTILDLHDFSMKFGEDLKQFEIQNVTNWRFPKFCFEVLTLIWVGEEVILPPCWFSLDPNLGGWVGGVILPPAGFSLITHKR